MKSFWTDLLFASILLLVVIIYIHRGKQFNLEIELFDENGHAVELQEPALIHYWSTWSKPSHRDIQVLQRFTKKHSDIQLIGVYSQKEDKDQLQNIQLEMGIYYPLASTPFFPESIPLTVVIQNGERQFIHDSLRYERLMEIFQREH